MLLILHSADGGRDIAYFRYITNISVTPDGIQLDVDTSKVSREDVVRRLRRKKFAAHLVGRVIILKPVPFSVFDESQQQGDIKT